jgi:hypothetical protein
VSFPPLPPLPGLPEASFSTASLKNLALYMAVVAISIFYGAMGSPESC